MPDSRLGQSGASPLGLEPGAAVLVGHSRATEPSGTLWTLYVTDQLVDAIGEDWTEPVRFRFERGANGVLEMWVRKEGA